LPKTLYTPHTKVSVAALPLVATVGALGIVYGDIGTSPLYAFREAIKAGSAGGSSTPQAVLGVVSLIIWSLLLIVSLKYAVLILRADNRGEGGILALLALLGTGRARPGTWRSKILVLGLVPIHKRWKTRFTGLPPAGFTTVLSPSPLWRRSSHRRRSFQAHSR
jgi:KUP system potassium uptake protein